LKAKEREQDLIDKLHQKMKQYKRQLDEAVSVNVYLKIRSGLGVIIARIITIITKKKLVINVVAV
jgi:hypothetical protein